ncbi:MAG TPA: abortive infection family protein [Polyangia bacterium]|nr:abortive infection family protein [Polyangia bacterium]
MTELSKFERIEQFQNMLIAAATGGESDARLFWEIRREMLADASITARAPRFIRTCRDAGAFWEYIKGKFRHYAERRAFIRAEFDPLLTFLESGETTPLAGTTDLALRTLDEQGVHDTWRRMLERRTGDPEGAITAARTLVETVCKHILDDLQVAYSDNVELPGLYTATAGALNLAPSQHTEQVFKQILGGCATVVNGLAGIRNRLSDAHGKGKAAVRPAPRHAELTVNLAGSLAAFLVATWEERRTKQTTTAGG